MTNRQLTWALVIGGAALSAFLIMRSRKGRKVVRRAFVDPIDPSKIEIVEETVKSPFYTAAALEKRYVMGYGGCYDQQLKKYVSSSKCAAQQLEGY